MNKIHLAAFLFASGALTASAFADDTATPAASTAPPAQAKQAWQQLSPEQRQAIMAEHKEDAMAKKAAWTQKSGEEKAAMRQEMQRKMEMRHERHENRREFGQRMGR